jgi:hypothetical protein
VPVDFTELVTCSPTACGPCRWHGSGLRIDEFDLDKMWTIVVLLGGLLGVVEERLNSIDV